MAKRVVLPAEIKDVVELVLAPDGTDIILVRRDNGSNVLRINRSTGQIRFGLGSEVSGSFFTSVENNIKLRGF